MSDASKNEKLLPKWILLVCGVTPAIVLLPLQVIDELYPSYYLENLYFQDLVSLIFGMYFTVTPVCLFGYFALKLDEIQRKKFIVIVVTIEFFSYFAGLAISFYYFPLSGPQIGYSLLPSFVIALLAFIPIALILSFCSILLIRPSLQKLNQS